MGGSSVRSQLLFLVTAPLTFVLAAAPHADGAKDIQPLPERFEVVRIEDIRGAALPEQAAAPLTVRFDAYEKRLILDLLPADIFIPGAKTISVGADGETEVPTINYSFTGKVYGVPNSAVHLTLIGESFKGLVAVENDVFVVEPAADFAIDFGSGEVVVSRLGENPLPELACDVTVLDTKLPFADRASQFAISQNLPSEPAPSLRIEPTRRAYRLALGLLGDAAFVLGKHGGDEALARADMDAAVNSAGRVCQVVEKSNGHQPERSDRLISFSTRPSSAYRPSPSSASPATRPSFAA